MMQIKLVCSSAEKPANQDIFRSLFSTVKAILMPIGDIADPLERRIVEIKKGPDLINWKHTNAQLATMNGPKFADWDKHLIWWVDNKMTYKRFTRFNEHFIFMEYRTLVANGENVRVHVVFNETMFKDKLKEIFAGKYVKPLQRFMNPPRELDQIGRGLNLVHGITVPLADDASKATGKMEFLKILGYRKDGELKAVARKGWKYVMKWKEFIDRLVENDV